MANEVLEEFLIESFDNLSKISEDLTRLDKNPNDSELLNKIYRVIHTLKGSASFLNFQKLRDLTHSAENVLDLIRDKKLVITSDVIDILLQSSDLSLKFVQNIEKSEKEGDVPYVSNKLKLLTIIENSLVKENLVDETVIYNQPMEKKLVEKKTLVSFDRDVDVIEENNESTEQDITTKATISDSVVRVNVNLLDKIMNEVGELVLTRNQILQYASNSNSNELLRLVQQLNVITTDLQTDIMVTRMQPISVVLNKFERVIRDLARETDKEVNLKTSGHETELDKTIIEAISGPMTHLVRNAIDHGIERPIEREIKDKNPVGTVEVKAFHESGQVVIEISDDGAGLDKAKILNKAVEKQIVTEEEALKMNEESTFALIFKPGFSTAEKITNISGRGVGMDVVRSSIENIGGIINVSSTVDRGSSFKLKIPLTLAIVPALIVITHNDPFAIPQANIVELVRVEDTNKHNRIEKVNNKYFFRLRENLIPIFWLDKELGLTETIDNILEVNIVILKAEDRLFGLVVDEILNTEEIVVKPFGRGLKEIVTFAGATIMGDGNVALIVDAIGFFKYVNAGISLKENLAKDLEHEVKEDSSEQREYQENLVIKLADDRPYCIPLSIVYRLEEVKAQDVEFTGKFPVVRYQDRPMPLINIERTLKLNEVSVLDKFDELANDSIIFCVVVSLHNSLYGLVVKEIEDISLSDVVVDSTGVQIEGITGNLFMKSKLYSLLDPYLILNLQSFRKALNDNISKSDLEGKRILFVDDSAMYRKLVGDALKETGAIVVIADDGQGGINRFNKDTNYDLIVTDIEMPIMDGFQMTEKIRALPKGQGVPIIALSTRVSDSDREKGQQVGFNHHIEKFKKDQLLELISQCLGGENGRE